MRVYSKLEEENIRTRALVREWIRSGLLDQERGSSLAEQLRTDLVRTNDFLRLILLLFTGLILLAGVFIVIELANIRGARATAFLCGISAVVFYALAELAINRYRLYRFGVEEALALASVGFIIAAAIQSVWDARGTSILGMSLAIGAIGALLLYGRFGFVYAGVAAIACAASIPFPLVQSEVTKHLLSGAILAAIFVFARFRYLVHGDDFPGDDYSVFQSSAWAGLYLVLNMQITGSSERGWFYWFTYVMIWLLPIAGLVMSIRKKERLLIDVSAAMALATLMTNKSYLGLPRQTWDPILFGLFLMAAALLIRRWLARGPNGNRFGFTPARILNKDTRLMTIVSTVSAAFQPQTPSHAPAATAANRPEVHGGRSGGAGATGEF